MKKILMKLDLFFEKTPHGINIDDVKEHLLKMLVYHQL